MAYKLSERQQEVVSLLREGRELDREGFYERGFRMPTVRSLVARGIVKQKKVPVMESGKPTGETKRVYFCFWHE